LYLSAVIVLAMDIGTRLMERKDVAQGRILRAWNMEVAVAFKHRILVFSEFTAPVCSPLHVSNPRSFRDSMVAAAALEHGFTLVTRNVSDFVGISGLQLLNPWDFKG